VSSNNRIIFRRASRASETIRTFLFYPLLPKSDTVTYCICMYVPNTYVKIKIWKKV